MKALIFEHSVTRKTIVPIDDVMLTSIKDHTWEEVKEWGKKDPYFRKWTRKRSDKECEISIIDDIMAWSNSEFFEEFMESLPASKYISINAGDDDSKPEGDDLISIEDIPADVFNYPLRTAHDLEIADLKRENNAAFDRIKELSEELVRLGVDPTAKAD